MEYKNINYILECVLLLSDNASDEELIDLGISKEIIDISKKVYRNIGWLMEANKIDKFVTKELI